jgi:Asp-tRNA(Asn)/Glu-tRNA(Gln) amidotransferase A subunit family amidase
MSNFQTFCRIFPVLLFPVFFQGCSFSPINPASPSRDRAYTAYYGPPAGESGGLRVAVKDLIDMKGTVTSAGSEYLARNNPPATRDAECLKAIRERKVRIVGKTNLTEFALGTAGMNDYFGTPRNPMREKRRTVPGGSSSGSAVAVADGSADVAIGTDTAGSIRTPAACCGILGLKTTFHLVSLKGVAPISAKHLDTVGPMARDVPHLVEGMDLLRPGFSSQYRNAVAAKPSGRTIRVGRLYLPGTDSAIDQAVDEALAAHHFQVVKLDERFREKWQDAQKNGRSIALADGWLGRRDFLGKPGVSGLTKATILLGEIEYNTRYPEALAARAEWQRELRRVFRHVDFIALPTLRTMPPSVPFFVRAAIFEAAFFDVQNTVAVNYAGNPAVAIPVPVKGKGKRVTMTSLQLIGPRLSEAQLVNAARIIESGRGDR